MQTILVAIIVLVATIYALFIRPNYYKFNGGNIYFETVYSETLARKENHQFHSYGKHLYICNQNGFKKLTLEGESIWDKVFYLENPRLYTEGKYMAVVGMAGNEAYAFDEDGLLMSVKTEYPIILADISSEGALVLVQEKEDMNIIQLYNRTGKLVVERGTSIHTDGYPMAVDLSSTGEKMATSYLSINNGKIESVLSIFGFNKEGEGKPESILGGFILGDEMAPEVKFLDDDHLVVIGDQKIYFYYVEDVPKLDVEISISNEIEQIEYFDENLMVYFGDAKEANREENKNHIAIYSKEGQELGSYPVETEIEHMIGEGSFYYLITKDSLEYHNIKKKVWRADLNKEVKDILRLEKNRFLFLYQNGYSVVKVKDI